jgi:hypothetical protein
VTLVSELKNDFKELQSSMQYMEKKASILGLLGAGALIHMVPNVAMKAMKSTGAGRKILAGSLSAGIDMGRKGLKLHPNAQSALQYGLGPESLVEHQVGHKIGTRISEMPAERQDRFLGKFEGMVRQKVNSLSPEDQAKIHKAPIIGGLLEHFNGSGNKTSRNLFNHMSVPIDQKKNLLNYGVDAAALAGAGALNPHLLIQPALSLTRKKVSESEFGKRILTKLYEKGKNGEEMSKARSIATDLVVSPSVLDPYRIGKLIHPHVDENTEGVEKLVRGTLQQKTT